MPLHPSDALAHSPSWLFPSYIFLSIIPLVVKSSSYRRLFFIPIVALTYYFLFHTTTRSITTDYGLTCGWLTLFFISSDFILLTDVQRELRSTKPPQIKPISQEGLWARITWAYDLFTSPRGIGWAHEPSNAVLPPRPACSKSSFLMKQFARLAMLGLIYDIATWHNYFNPAYFRDGPSLTAYGWFWRYESIWGWALQAYTVMAAQNCFVSILSVSLGRSDAEDWPWLFGSFSSAWTIRRFWGRTWHQLLRRFVTAHGRFVSGRLGLTRGSNFSAYVQLYTAFFLSAIIHSLGDYTLLRNWNGGAFKFFLWQAVAITFEDGVIALGRNAGLKGSAPVWRVLGYVWVWTWFAVCFPTWQDPLMSAGMMSEEQSFLQTAWRKWLDARIISE
ncbi:membrane bound O-acyl transferase family-domain-containing protein [Collybia nuda]|uniref:Membrane bound O-acyl transferase family-domain-containing protein n=1 Tax=Collybia nuda TaxID=64659 RepID=A0A9P6CIL5_9AGAR|nr:membrane bound O-acyl transferase family-domain-containing protein [Collybia nuda]